MCVFGSYLSGMLHNDIDILVVHSLCKSCWHRGSHRLVRPLMSPRQPTRVGDLLPSQHAPASCLQHPLLKRDGFLCLPSVNKGLPVNNIAKDIIRKCIKASI